jgi:hypothetical protein
MMMEMIYDNDMPDEIINLIIYKHKGLEHPCSKIIKEGFIDPFIWMDRDDPDNPPGSLSLDEINEMEDMDNPDGDEEQMQDYNFIQRWNRDIDMMPSYHIWNHFYNFDGF